MNSIQFNLIFFITIEVCYDIILYFFSKQEIKPKKEEEKTLKKDGIDSKKI